MNNDDALYETFILTTTTQYIVNRITGFFFWVCVYCVFHHIKYVGVHSQWEKKYVQGLSDSLVVMTFFVVQTLSPLPHY